MKRGSLFLAALATVVGCYTGSATDVNREPDPSPGDVDKTDPTHRADARAPKAASADDEVPSGLPCDVAAIVQNACNDCHGARPSGGAKNTLVSYEDFAAPSKDDGTVAKTSLARMKSKQRPMPPSGPLEADTVAVFEKWVAAGLPRGSCGDKAPPAASDDGREPAPEQPPARDAGPPPVSVCTSGTHPPDDEQSLLMMPGGSCITCHADNHAAVQFEIAGTVFPTMHEPDNCAGVSDAKVLIIDRTGNIHTMDTNSSGNFTRLTSFPRPYRAMVIRNGEVRTMKSPQTDGNCNGCHSEWGNGAPGRVRAP